MFFCNEYSLRLETYNNNIPNNIPRNGREMERRAEGSGEKRGRERERERDFYKKKKSRVLKEKYCDRQPLAFRQKNDASYASLHVLMKGK